MTAKVLRFPGDHCDSRFGRGSSKTSGEIAPLVYLMSGSRHLCGTDLRCRHFSSALSLTPSARAATATKSQLILSLMTWIYADNTSARQDQFGLRLKCLETLTLFLVLCWEPVVEMAKEIERNAAEEAEEIAIHKRVKARMKAFRLARGWNQTRMAEMLGISKENYQKYEYMPSTGTIRKVPVVVITRFCDFLDLDVSELLYPKRRRA